MEVFKKLIPFNQPLVQIILWPKSYDIIYLATLSANDSTTAPIKLKQLKIYQIYQFVGLKLDFRM